MSICPKCERVSDKVVFVDKETGQRHCSACYNLNNKDESLLWCEKQYKRR